MSNFEQNILIITGYIAFISVFVISGYWCFKPSWNLLGLIIVMVWLNNTIYNIRTTKGF